MMKGINDMKKIISVMLLGSLLVTGAVVYADTLSETDGTKNRQVPPGIEQRVNGDEALLSKLVSEGVITAAEKTSLQEAMEAQRAERQAAMTAAKESGEKPEALGDREKPEAGTKPASHFARMAEDGLITQELADKIDGYLTEQREAAFAAEVEPLVAAGTFEDADAVKDAMDAVREAMQEQMESLKPASEDREKIDFKSLTEAERTALKEKMDAKRTAMQEEREAAHEAIYSDLVEDGTLTQAQADALQNLVKERATDGKGNAPGFGGMGGHGRGPGAPSEAAE